jgi:hypothetical protein
VPRHGPDCRPRVWYLVCMDPGYTQLGVGSRARGAWNVEHGTLKVDWKSRLIIGAASGLLVQAAAAIPDAAAEPLDLRDRQPRRVIVEFEISPREKPAQTNRRYTGALLARIEPGERDGEIRVVIPGDVVEKSLVADESPIPGTFSDFVWVFDSETGHVRSATFQGHVERQLDWGFMTSRAHAEIQVDMGTERIAGFRQPRNLLGQLFFSHCADLSSPRCTVVEARPLDPATGYVNAVGGLRVRSSVMDLNGFSPLGEAIFSELDPVVMPPRHPNRPPWLEAISVATRADESRWLLIGGTSDSGAGVRREVN